MSFFHGCYVNYNYPQLGKDLVSVMNALVDETAAKVHALPPRQAQTGPAVRFDENVLEAQMKLMEGELLQQELYRKLSESIHEYQKKVK